MILENLKDKKILLASKSPRRQELLKALGISFEIVVVNCDETYPNHLKNEKITDFISETKAKAYSELKKNEILITADTLVVLDDQILGKPKNEAHAFEMIKSLSQNTHQVYTSVSIKSTDQLITISDKTEVSFDFISDDEINYYIENYKPMDKAGAYGIQEWLGFAKVSKIVGCYYNVMGLPLNKLYHTLKKF